MASLRAVCTSRTLGLHFFGQLGDRRGASCLISSSILSLDRQRFSWTRLSKDLGMPFAIGRDLY